MEVISNTLRKMIRISDVEFQEFLQQCHQEKFKRKSLLSEPGRVPREIFFIQQGLVRVMITDQNGIQHTIHFTLENQFIADYSSFMQQLPSFYSLQALEETQVVVLPRSASEWG